MTFVNLNILQPIAQKIRSEPDSEKKATVEYDLNKVYSAEELHQMLIPIPIELVRKNLNAFKEDAFNRLLLRYSGKDVAPNGWQQGPTDDGIQVVYGDVVDNAWQTMRATGKVGCSAETACRILACQDMVPRYDEMVKEIRRIEKLDETTDVRVVLCKGIMLTSPRNICALTTMRREKDGRWLIATRSVAHPEENQDGYTRALVYISGYVITPDLKDPNMCEISVVAHMDLGGIVPAFVMKHIGLAAPIKMVKAIQELIVQEAKASHE